MRIDERTQDPEAVPPPRAPERPAVEVAATGETEAKEGRAWPELKK